MEKIDKTAQIKFCTEKVLEMLNCIRPGHKWSIEYGHPAEMNISNWRKKYFGLVDGEEYFVIFISGEAIYCVNVTGDSVLTAVCELINRLAQKF